MFSYFKDKKVFSGILLGSVSASLVAQTNCMAVALKNDKEEMTCSSNGSKVFNPFNLLLGVVVLVLIGANFLIKLRNQDSNIFVAKLSQLQSNNM